MDWKSTDFYSHELWIVNFIMHTYKYGHWNTVHTWTQTLHVPQTCLSPPEWYPPNWKSLWTLEPNKAPKKENILIRKDHAILRGGEFIFSIPVLPERATSTLPCRYHLDDGTDAVGAMYLDAESPWGPGRIRNEVTKSKWPSHESTVLYNESQKPFGEMQEFSLFTVEGSLLKYCSWNHMQT